MASPFPIWDGAAPGALGTRPQDVPTLEFFPSDAPRGGPAMLVLPGGGYGGHTAGEIAPVAAWLARNGIPAFVLRYRLGALEPGAGAYRHPAMLDDAKRALRLLRARAAEFGFDPARIGVIGCSAGGHLAATLLTLWDGGDPQAADPVERFSSRPELGILCYPVITLGPFTEPDSRRRLLGPDPDPALLEALSAEKRVTAETPPCFVWHTVGDTVVPVENSLLFAEALRAKGVPFALHIHERGEHAIVPDDHPWTDAALGWLGLRWPLRLDG